MRVVIISRLYAPEPAAAAFRLKALAESLSAGGHSVVVLTTRPSRLAPAGDESAANVVLRRWPALRDRDGQVRGFVQYLSFDVPAFFRLLFSRKVDVVISEPPPTTGFVVTVAAKVKRIPHVHYAADCWSDAAAAMGAPPSVVRVVRWLESVTMRHATAVVTVNDAIAARLAHLHPTVTPVVVGNGVDTKVFRRDGPERHEPRPYVVYAGTTSEWQGVDVLIDAWREVISERPGAELVLVGGGSQWEALQEQVRRLNLGKSVRFVPTVPGHEAASWLRSAVVSIVSLKPGIGYDYALPTKVLASLATGTPVVFSGEGVTKDWLRSLAPDVLAGSEAVGTSSGEVARVVSRFLSNPPGHAERVRLAEWAAGEVSLSAVAQRVTTVVERAARNRG